jgi:hypothetical protein
MRLLRNILPVVLAALLLGSCRSTSSLRKQKEKEEQENVMFLRSLLEPPPVQELTASVSFDVSGNRVNGQLRMRRDRSIQISASMLGLVEVARIEFLPDMVVVTDRIHNVYTVCHYAEIPYRNEFGLSFEVVQALLWNRMFVPESADITDASTRLTMGTPEPDGSVYFRDIEYGYRFTTDGKKYLKAVSKSGSGYSFRIDYSDFTDISGSLKFPLGLGMEISLSGLVYRISAKLSSVSVENRNWADRTAVSRRLRQVPLDEFLENLDL